MKTKQILHQDMHFEFKDMNSDDDEFFYFKGYGSTFGNVDLGQDVILGGAFSKSLKERMPKLCYQHDMGRPLGVFTSAKEDSKGLLLEGKMPKANSLVSDTIPLMKCGAIDSMSIGYSIPKGGYEMDAKGIRQIKQVDLYEVSLVTMPMNPKAILTGMKKFGIEDVEDIKTRRELEEFLIDAGCFSKQAAVYIASKFQDDARRESAAGNGSDHSSQGEPGLHDLLSAIKSINIYGAK